MKAGLIAPLYLSVSWVLTVSYQLFTDTAVRAVASSINVWSPAAGAWITSNVETIVFVYAFTWIFVLSSVIPSVILGKERGVLAQYIVVLALTLIAFYMADILQAFVGIQISDILNTAALLTNPILAVFYLSVPYLFMIGLDTRSRRALRGKKQFEKVVNEISQAPKAEN